MRQFFVRTFALLLKIKARCEFLKFRHRGMASFSVLLILSGTFLVTRPVAACGFTEVNCWAPLLIQTIGLGIATFFNSLIAVVLEFMIPVMLYNSFTTAPVVVQGWALVRDTVNMFFVIVLIFIAFGTIFGNERFKWSKQVPRLLIFAILINFSKTICGLMIDFGQVVMLTFANALREIAAGNIIEMFGLNKVLSGASGASTGDWDLALASLGAAFVTAWVLMIMLLLLAVLVYRVVALWVLIVVSPLTWFVGGAGGESGVIKSKGYADWWSQFSCMVAVGPVLTFFLWLALAVAGAGTVAEGFDYNKVELGASGGFFTKIFEFQSFMSMIIGSAILMAGLKQAESVCSGVSGKLNPMAVGKAARTIAGGFAVKGVGKVGRFGLGTLKKGGNLGVRAIKKVPALSSQRAGARWRGIADRAGSGFIGRNVRQFGNKRADKLLGQRPAEIAKAGAKFSGDSAKTQAGLLSDYVKSGGPLAKDKALGLFQNALGNKDMMAELEKQPGGVAALWSKYGASMEQGFKDDPATMEKLNAFKKKNAHITGATEDLKTAEDVGNLSDEALADTEVQKKLSNLQIVVGKGSNAKTMSGMDAIVQGKFGADKQKLVQNNYDSYSPDQLRSADAKSVTQHASLDTVNDMAGYALDDKNVSRVNEIASQLLAQYKKTDTTDEKRLEISTALDNLKAQVKAKIGSGTPGVYANQLKSLQRTFDVDRRAAEEATSRVGADGQPAGSNFGSLGSSIAQAPNPDKFIQHHFGNASAERRKDAGRQIKQQHTEAESAADVRLQELKTGVTGAGGMPSAGVLALEDEMQALRAQMADKKQELMDQAKADVRAASPQIANKQSEIDLKDQEFKSSSRRGAPLEDLTRLSNEINALKAEKATLEQQADATIASVDNHAELTALQQQLKTNQDAQVQELRASSPNIDTDPALKGILDSYSQAQQNVKKLKEALTTLSTLPPNV